MSNQQLQTAPSKDFRTNMSLMQGQFRMALPKTISPERFTRVVFTATQVNPLLLQCTQESLFAGIMKAAERGLVPDGRMGALIPFRNRHKGGVYEAQWIPMVGGLVDLARRSGEVADVYAEVVYEEDDFRYQLGLHRDLVHQPAMTPERGEIVGAYAVGVWRDQTLPPAWTFMWKYEIDAIRSRSRSKNNGPWVTDYVAMAKKTVIKQVLKYMPQCAELSAALEDDRQADLIIGDAPQATVSEVREEETGPAHEPVTDEPVEPADKRPQVRRRTIKQNIGDETIMTAGITGETLQKVIKAAQADEGFRKHCRSYMIEELNLSRTEPGFLREEEGQHLLAVVPEPVQTASQEPAEAPQEPAEPPQGSDQVVTPAIGEIVHTLAGEGTVVEVFNDPKNGTTVLVDLGDKEQGFAPSECNRVSG